MATVCCCSGVEEAATILWARVGSGWPAMERPPLALVAGVGWQGGTGVAGSGTSAAGFGARGAGVVVWRRRLFSPATAGSAAAECGRLDGLQPDAAAPSSAGPTRATRPHSRKGSRWRGALIAERQGPSVRMCTGCGAAALPAGGVRRVHFWATSAAELMVSGMVHGGTVLELLRMGYHGCVPGEPS